MTEGLQGLTIIVALLVLLILVMGFLLWNTEKRNIK